MGSGVGGIYENTYGHASDGMQLAERPLDGKMKAAYRDGENHQEASSQRVTQAGNGVSIHSIEENAKATAGRYRITEAGNFGRHGMKKGNRIYECDDPMTESKAFYEALGRGASDRPVKGVDAIQRELGDGTLITYRQRTSIPDSPAVQISKSTSEKVRNQKVHFVRSEQ